MGGKDILTQIVAHKKDEVGQAKKNGFKYKSRPGKEPIDFSLAINKKNYEIAVIAEVKKASPSTGVLVKDFDAQKIVNNYQKANANALSILTDEYYFQGHNDYLSEAHLNCDLPILRKDFIIDSWQIEESYLIGADAILLIAKILTKAQLEKFHKQANSLNLSVLVEVHNKNELDMALSIGAKIIGINNRNLTNFTIDLNTSFSLVKTIPSDIIKVSESGINSFSQVERLAKAEFNAILVGASLVKSSNIKQSLKKLLGK
ncbi:MAG: indole-3-glycerol phosphate synthase TrpC [SAR324 cluster bacterium]|nr:indole-3-glycerol phosphate synthase TrpC [SAR324 cluster bacterium]